MKKGRGAQYTAIGGIAFGCLLVGIGVVSLIAPDALAAGGYDGGIPTSISGTVLIIAGVGIAIPFAIELRRLLRKD